MIVSVGVLTTLGLVLADRKIAFDREEQLATESLYRMRASLEESFYKRLTLLVSLEAFVKSHPDLDLTDPVDKQSFQGYFERFTASLDQQVPGILSIQLAPDGIVTYLTNVERNRQAIGHDLLKDDARRDQVLETIRQRGALVAGPLELKQGGVAIIARNAIYTRPGAYIPQRYVKQNRAQSDMAWLQEIPADFWGFATVLIDQEKLFQDAGIHHSNGRYRYAIHGRHGLGAAGEVFFGEASIFDHPLTTATVSLPNGEWLIGVQLVSGVSWRRSLLITAIGIGGAGILGYSLLSREKTELQLQQANQALIRATRLKDEFLANMSHELRTPLNAVLGITESLQEGIFGEINQEQNQALQTIERSGNHLLELINDILDVAKIESGQIELSSKLTAVAPLCQSGLVFIKQQALKKHIHIETLLPQNLPILLLDARRIRQVLINLLSNAVKFTPDGGCITLAVSSQHLPDDPESVDSPTQNYLRIAVIDTGIGIAPKHINKLFQPFVQIDGALNRKYQGTGLGLALVKRIVELHGGRVGVTSQVGVGSCFTVDLPCHPAAPFSSTAQAQTIA